jgi:hypothetical protein
MLRRIRSLRALLWRLPRNRVFRFAISGPKGRGSRLAFLAILSIETILLFLYLHRAVTTWGGGHTWECLAITVGIHSLAAPFLVIGGMWAYNRLFTRAQKEDMWLTGMKPSEAVFGAIMPPTIGAALVILGVPLLLICCATAFEYKEIWRTIVKYLEHGWIFPPGRIWLSRFWTNLMIVFAVCMLYLCVFPVLWRVLVEGIIRGGSLRITTAVRAFFMTAIALLIVCLAILGSGIYMESRRRGLAWEVILQPALMLQNGIVLFSCVMAGVIVCLCQHPGRRWFADVVEMAGDEEEEEDWLAAERPLLSMDKQGPWRVASPVGMELPAFVPALAFSGLIAAGSSSYLLWNAWQAAAPRVGLARFNEEMSIIPTLFLAALLGGVLALRREGIAAWRWPLPIQSGRIAGTVRAVALVSAVSCHVPALFIGFKLNGAGLDDLEDLIMITVLAFVTLIPVWLLHCALLCLWRLREMHRTTTIVVSLCIVALGLSLILPDALAARVGAVIAMSAVLGIIMFWVGGGSFWLYQRLYDQEC